MTDRGAATTRPPRVPPFADAPDDFAKLLAQLNGSEKAPAVEHGRGVDRPFASRLRRLDALLGEVEQGRRPATELSSWFDADVAAAVGFEDLQDESVHPPAWLRGIEAFRNVCVLVPITLTWLGLDRAARLYAKCEDAQLDSGALGRTPFLKLWEIGFSDTKQLDRLGLVCRPPDPPDSIPDWIVSKMSDGAGLVVSTFSATITADVLVLLLIILLTVVVHAWYAGSSVEATNVHARRVSDLRRYVASLEARLRVLRPSTDVARLAEQSSHAMTKLVGEFTAHGTTLVNALDQQRDAAQKSLDRLHDAIDDTTKKTVALDAKLITGIDAIEKSSRAAAEHVRSTATSAKTARDEVARLGGQVTTAERAATTVRDVATGVTKSGEELKTQMSGLTGIVGRAQEEVQEAARSATDGAKSLKTSAEAVSRTAKSFDGVSTDLARATDALGVLKRLGRDLRDALEADRTALVDEFKRLLEEAVARIGPSTAAPNTRVNQVAVVGEIAAGAGILGALIGGVIRALAR